MNWYLQRGKDSDVVNSIKINYSRNLRNYKFNTNSSKDIQQIENLIKTNLPSLGYGLRFIKMNDIDDLGKRALYEKGLINQEVLENNTNKISLLINDEENICVLLNFDNHFEIQVFSSGMELENTFNFAKEIDEKFDQTFDIAKSKKYGYLTTSPINVGTGLKVEVIVHLPGLTKTGNIRKIIQTIDNFGLNINGMFVKNQEVIGDLYKISNKQTLGITEESIINNLRIIIDKIIEQERKARKLLGTNKIELEDMVYRNFGILSNAKKIKFREALEIMSDIKMGTDLGIISELNDEKVSKIYFYMNSANLQKRIGEQLDSYDQEIKRAEVIKQIINEKWDVGY